MLKYADDGSVYDDGQPNFSWVDNHVEPLKITVTKAPPAWVDSTPAPYQNPDASPADIAAYRVAQSVKRPSRLPVEQTLIPDAPTRPSYVMEPDLQEAQGGMQLPPGMMQDDSGRLFYADDPTTTIPMVRRPGLLPIANTPEGYKLVMPKMLDLASNVMGNVGGLAGGTVAAKAGEMVLGSGMVRKADQSNIWYHGTASGDLRGGESGLHLGTQKAAQQALEARIGIPADGKGWTGNRAYGETLLAGRKTLEKMDPKGYNKTGFNAKDLPEEDFYPSQILKYADKTEMPMTVKPSIDAYKIKGNMTNTVNNPHEDFKANGYMRAQITKGNPKNGYYYTNQGEDSGSISAVVPNGNHLEKVLRSDTRNQVAGQVGHQVEKNGFYSALQTAVSNLPNETMTGDQWWKRIWEPASTKQVGVRDANNKPTGEFKTVESQARSLLPGVKAEELENVGVENWLKSQKGPVSKQQLEDIVKQNKVELGEKVLGGDKLDHKIKYNDEDKLWDILDNRGNVVDSGYQNERAANREVLRLAGHEQHISAGAELNRGTKYHQYQLPGGENYKEMLLKLPQNMDQKLAARWKELDAKPYNELLTKERIELDDLSKNIIKYRKSENFNSSHWDEPNVLAHIRMNDRNIENTTAKQAYDDYEASLRKKYGGEKSSTGGANINTINKGTDEEFGKLKELGSKVNNKTLHIEEIQSDWHQKGRKEGYKLSDSQKTDLENIDNKLTSGLSEKDIGNPDMDSVLKTAVEKKVLTPEEAKNYKEYSKGENSTVPDAPFKRNWDELALKRVIRHAAENGYEGVSWTPGEAQAARYDLSKQVEAIRANKNPNGTYQIGTKLPGHNMARPMPELPYVPANKLSDIVGKELADKIVKGEGGKADEYGRVYSGIDLKIGGEGMKSFYDKMLIDRANGLIKKYGSKVEQKEIGIPHKAGVQGQDLKIHYFPITPALRDKATKEGFPLFSSSPILTPIQGSPFEPKYDHDKHIKYNNGK